MRIVHRSMAVAAAMLFVCAQSSKAQMSSRFQLFGGYVTSKFTNVELDDGVKHGGLTGFTAGIGLERGIAAHVQFAPAIQVIQKGDKTSYSSEAFGVVFSGYNKATVTYAQLTLQLKASSGKDGSGFFGTVGPAIGIVIRCRARSVSTSNSEFVPNSDTTTDCKDESQVSAIKSTDVAVAIGAGFASSSFFVQVRYDAGLNDVNNDPEAHRSNKNTSLMFMVGLRL